MDISFDLSEHIMRALYQKGWLFVGTVNTGMMFKDGYLLVLHNTFVQANENDFEMSYPKCVDVLDLFSNKESCFSYVPYRKSYVNPKRCNWHVEYNGWLIGKGTFQEVCSELTKSGTSSTDFPQIQKMFDDEIDKIAACADLNMLERDKVKSREVLLKKDETILVPVSAPPNFGIGSYFRATDKKIFSFFQENVVYKIHAIDEESGQIIIKTMNDSLTKERRVKDFFANAEAFIQLARNHSIETVTLEYDTEEKEVTKWIQFNSDIETSVASIPQDIKEICNSKHQEYYTTLAFNEGLNITPLLISGMSEDYYKSVYELIKQFIDINQIVDKLFNEDLMLLLLKLKELGYDLKDMQQNEYSRMELEDILDEVNRQFTEEFSSFIETCDYPTSITYVKARYYDNPNVSMYLLNQPRVYLELIDYNKEYPSNLATQLINEGFVSTNSVYLLSDDFKKSDLKEFIQEIFIAYEITIEDLDNLISRIKVVLFVYGNLAFETDSYRVCFDTNSIFVIDKASNKVIYRKILLSNSEVIWGSEVMNNL